MSYTQARVNILQVHTRKMHLDDTILDQLATRTDGFTGADLESLCREVGIWLLITTVTDLGSDPV